MKAPPIFIILSLLLFPCLSHSVAAEIRTVGGTEVDIQPVIDWAAKKKGERPLKHWKLVRILELKRQSPIPVVLCDIEGLKTEINLKNCPKGILDLLGQKKALEAKLGAARNDQQAASVQFGRSAKRREAKQAKRDHAAAKQLEKTVNREMADLERRIKQHQSVYAMATGATFNGLPIWDTGLKSP